MNSEDKAYLAGLLDAKANVFKDEGRLTISFRAKGPMAKMLQESFGGLFKVQGKYGWWRVRDKRARRVFRKLAPYFKRLAKKARKYGEVN